MEFIVYALVDPRDKAIRYVGQTGNLRQRKTAHGSPVYPLSRRLSRHSKWVKELRELGLRSEITILEYCQTRQEALERESFWIHKLIAEGHQLNNIEAFRTKKEKKAKLSEEALEFNLIVRVSKREQKFLQLMVAECQSRNGYGKESNVVRLALRRLAKSYKMPVPAGVFDVKPGGNWLPKKPAPGE